MASQLTVDDLISYYINLLIVQYRGGVKAQANIGLLANLVIASGVYFDVQEAYNIDSNLGATAIGKQLDVIGKYVGVNRYSNAVVLDNYSALVTYSEAGALPSSPPAFGLTDYADFSNFDYNGTLVYNDIITSTNALSDSDFLTLIRFVIICNNMNYSAGAIDSALYEIFGNQIRAETAGNMEMVFFLSGPITVLLTTIVFKGLLPAPMGVGKVLVQNIQDLMFGMVTYDQYARGIYSSFASGFSTYSNYATLPGQTLTYSQISQA